MLLSYARTEPRLPHSAVKLRVALNLGLRSGVLVQTSGLASGSRERQSRSPLRLLLPSSELCCTDTSCCNVLTHDIPHIDLTPLSMSITFRNNEAFAAFFRGLTSTTPIPNVCSSVATLVYNVVPVLSSSDECATGRLPEYGKVPSFVKGPSPHAAPLPSIISAVSTTCGPSAAARPVMMSRLGCCPALASRESDCPPPTMPYSPMCGSSMLQRSSPLSRESPTRNVALEFQPPPRK